MLHTRFLTKALFMKTVLILGNKELRIKNIQVAQYQNNILHNTKLLMVSFNKYTMEEIHWWSLQQKQMYIWLSPQTTAKLLPVIPIALPHVQSLKLQSPTLVWDTPGLQFRYCNNTCTVNSLNTYFFEIPKMGKILLRLVTPQKNNNNNKENQMPMHIYTTVQPRQNYTQGGETCMQHIIMIHYHPLQMYTKNTQLERGDSSVLTLAERPS